MQAALDSTALMLSKEAGTDTSGQLQTNAVKYFNALFTRPEATNVTITATYTTSGGSQVVVNGSANVPTKFLGVIGHQDITVNGSSTAKWGSSRLRVALVLDNTGSMADDGKIDALKSATKNLLTQLQNAASTNGDVYVSIIPFSKDVNVGSSNYNANWIDWSDWDDDNGHDVTAQRHRPARPKPARMANRRRSARPPRPGCRTTTIPGTAASPIATWTTIRR